MDDKSLVSVESAGDSLVRLAIEKGIDVDNLQRLIDMRNAEIARVAKEDFQRNFAIMQSEFVPVAREKQGYGYKYAPIELLQKTYGPIIAKHGFSYSWREASVEGMPDWKRCILTISGYGYSQENYFDIPPVERTKQMNAVQAVGAMSTYGRRYSFISGFGIIIDDEDPDGRPDSDIERLQDVKNSKGEFSKPADPGKMATKGDGMATRMIALRTEFYSIINASVFSANERKDANAEAHPGGRDLVSSESDEALLQSLIDKYKGILRDRSGESELEDGFRLSMGKAD